MAGGLVQVMVVVQFGSRARPTEPEIPFGKLRAGSCPAGENAGRRDDAGVKISFIYFTPCLRLISRENSVKKFSSAPYPACPTIPHTPFFQ